MRPNVQPLCTVQNRPPVRGAHSDTQELVMSRPTQDASHVEESMLVRRVVNGDDAAFEVLYKANRDAVFRFAYRRLGFSFEDAKEATIDTFMSAVQLAPTYRGSCSLGTWLCGIARLREIDRLRKQGRDKRLPLDALMTLSEAEQLGLRELKSARTPLQDVINQLELERLVHKMAATLLDDEREALMMHYVEGFSHQDISRILGRSVKGVKNLMTRGKQKLRGTLVEWME